MVNPVAFEVISSQNNLIQEQMTIIDKQYGLDDLKEFNAGHIGLVSMEDRNQIVFYSVFHGRAWFNNQMMSEQEPSYRYRTEIYGRYFDP